MASSNLGYMMLLIVALGIGCLFGVMFLIDLRNYRDLQRRLREEQRTREETESK